MFCFKARTILNAFEKLMPELYQGIHECWSATKEGLKAETLPDAIILDKDSLEELE